MKKILLYLSTIFCMSMYNKLYADEFPYQCNESSHIATAQSVLMSTFTFSTSIYALPVFHPDDELCYIVINSSGTGGSNNITIRNGWTATSPVVANVNSFTGNIPNSLAYFINISSGLFYVTTGDADYTLTWYNKRKYRDSP